MYERRLLTQPGNSSPYMALPCYPNELTRTASLSAQRNVYLTGFCLFLSLVLTRTFYIIQDLIHTKDEYAELKKVVRFRFFLSFRTHVINSHDQTASTSRNNLVASEQTKEIERLKLDLGNSVSSRTETYADAVYPVTLKEQAKSQATEYDRLADQYNKETGKPSSDKRVD
jgi:B-cell receptor-associated protein 31